MGRDPNRAQHLRPEHCVIEDSRATPESPPARSGAENLYFYHVLLVTPTSLSWALRDQSPGLTAGWAGPLLPTHLGSACAHLSRPPSRWAFGLLEVESGNTESPGRSWGNTGPGGGRADHEGFSPSTRTHWPLATRRQSQTTARPATQQRLGPSHSFPLSKGARTPPSHIHRGAVLDHLRFWGVSGFTEMPVLGVVHAGDLGTRTGSFYTWYHNHSDSETGASVLNTWSLCDTGPMRRLFTPQVEAESVTLSGRSQTQKGEHRVCALH